MDSSHRRGRGRPTEEGVNTDELGDGEEEGPEEGEGVRERVDF